MEIKEFINEHKDKITYGGSAIIIIVVLFLVYRWFFSGSKKKKCLDPAAQNKIADEIRKKLDEIDSCDCNDKKKSKPDLSESRL